MFRLAQLVVIATLVFASSGAASLAMAALALDDCAADCPSRAQPRSDDAGDHECQPFCPFCACGAPFARLAMTGDLLEKPLEQNSVPSAVAADVAPHPALAAVFHPPRIS